jgi:hypothetical protein
MTICIGRSGYVSDLRRFKKIIIIRLLLTLIRNSYQQVYLCTALIRNIKASGSRFVLSIKYQLYALSDVLTKELI